MHIAPYGSWSSPIRATDLVDAGSPILDGRLAGRQVWWSERRATDSARTVVVAAPIVARTAPDSRGTDLVPAPLSAATTVHEYGGGAWTVSDGGGRRQLVFAEYSQHRLYLAADGAATPLTPPDPRARFADLQTFGQEVICVREYHRAGGRIRRDICAVPLDGSAAEDAGAIRSLVAGSDFVAFARIHGEVLTWVAWNHPNMPWDGTELRMATLTGDGPIERWHTVAGGVGESVLQPEWVGDDLWFISDRTGWWNLYRIADAAAGAGPIEAMVDPGLLEATAAKPSHIEAMYPVKADMGGPLWQLGLRWYAPIGGRIVAVRLGETDTLGLLDPRDKSWTDLGVAGSAIQLLDADLDPHTGRARALVLAGSDTNPGRLIVVPLDRADSDQDPGQDQPVVVHESTPVLPPAEYLPRAEPIEVGDPSVHAFVYRPRNPDFTAPAGELPPYVAFVHGGPTSRVTGTLSLEKAYFTARGIGVVDINYGGSTGYGRAYRDRLMGQWGVVDVQDVATVMRALVDQGLADGARLAIRGGSAGGWTVLSCLTQTDVFACGTSYYGVADLTDFAQQTHDFESRYLDSLIGPLPQSAALYAERSPLAHVHPGCPPVLLLQGLDDPIVVPAQTEAFRRGLERNGVRHACLTFPGESHGFRQADTIVAAHQAELSFYAQIMGFDLPDTPRLPLSDRD